MKNIIFLFLFPVICSSQRVDTAYLIPSNGQFILHAESVHEDGRRVVEDTPMDSATLVMAYAKDVYAASNKVAASAIATLERRDVANMSMAKRNKIKSIAGADILDSIGLKIIDELGALNWLVSGIDTVSLPATFGVKDGHPSLSVMGTELEVYFYSESWFRIPNLYGKGKDEDFFLFRGVYTNLSYNIIFSAVAKSNQEKPAKVKRRATNK